MKKHIIEVAGPIRLTDVVLLNKMRGDAPYQEELLDVPTLYGILENGSSQQVYVTITFKKFNASGVTIKTDTRTVRADPHERVEIEYGFFDREPHNGWQLTSVQVQGRVQQVGLNMIDMRIYWHPDGWTPWNVLIIAAITSAILIGLFYIW